MGKGFHRETTYLGTIVRYDENGRRHNDNGPAVITSTGVQSWWKHGVRHNHRGPSIIKNGEPRAWHIEGQELDTFGFWYKANEYIMEHEEKKDNK